MRETKSLVKYIKVMKELQIYFYHVLKYICNLNSDIYEYKVFKEGKIYTFNFSSVDYYNMEYLRDFIKTIKIY